MPEPRNDNRRAHRRASLVETTRVGHDGDDFPGRILNISAGGAGLQMEVRLPDQTEITVAIDSVGIVPARIVRQMEDGVGVKFTFSEEKERMLVRKIAKLVAEKRRAQFHVVS